MKIRDFIYEIFPISYEIFRDKNFQAKAYHLFVKECSVGDEMMSNLYRFEKVSLKRNTFF